MRRKKEIFFLCMVFFNNYLKEVDYLREIDFLNAPQGKQINIDYIFKKKENPGLIAWGNALYPWKIDLYHKLKKEDVVMLNFQNADIINVLKFFEENYGVVFITDDAIQPVSPQGKSLYGSKINFTSHMPLSKEEAWNVLITLLELVGVTIQPGSMDRVYRVVTLAKNSPQNYNKGPLPTFINVGADLLPTSDMRIRYLYQPKNISLQVVANLIKVMQSSASPEPIEIKEMNAVLFVDRVFNIKTVLAVIAELDKLVSPEEMGVIRLENVGVQHVVELYKSIVKEENLGQNVTRIPGTKRRDMMTYFDPQVKLIPDVRNNLIIVLGSKDGIDKVKKFVITFQDVLPKNKYMPVHTYLLKYSDAESTANVLKQALGFKQDSEFGKYGVVSNGEKYLSDVLILAEPNTNSLLIQCSDQAYKYVYEILEKIDVEPRQVAVDIVVVSIEIEKIKSLGTQLRNSGNTDGQVNWQTGMLDTTRGIVGNYTLGGSVGGTRLLGNLFDLLVGSGEPSGTTVLSLGQDKYGIWGLVKMLVQELRAEIVNHPFLAVTPRYEASIEVGETRRIAATSITNANNEQQSYTSDEATLKIKMTTNISDDDKVAIQLDVKNSIFTAPEGNAISAGNKTTRNINTSVTVKDREIVAIGGIIIDHFTQSNRLVPWLGKIPIVGALFSNEQRNNRKSMLVIFVEPKIINKNESTVMGPQRICKNINTVYCENKGYSIYCPLKNLFFGSKSDDVISTYLKANSLTKDFYNFGTIAPCRMIEKDNNSCPSKELSEQIIIKKRKCRQEKICSKTV